MRLKQALGLIQSTDRSIEQMAIKLGYHDFSKLERTPHGRVGMEKIFFPILPADNPIGLRLLEEGGEE